MVGKEADSFEGKVHEGSQNWLRRTGTRCGVDVSQRTDIGAELAPEQDRVTWARIPRLSPGATLLRTNHPPPPVQRLAAAHPQSLINVVGVGAVRNGRENHGISPSESQ